MAACTRYTRVQAAMPPMNFRLMLKSDYSPDGIAWGKTTPVKNFLPNEIGLYDMSGNVSEWCFNLFKYHSDSTPFDEEINQRVCKGGSWYNDAETCTTYFRLKSEEERKDIGLGFRVAKDITFKTE